MITTTTQGAKFRKTVRGLRGLVGQCPVDVETVAVGLLERLWHATATSAIRGDIGRFDNELIAELVGWHLDADDLVHLLTACGWLDESEEHRLVVHDWHEHAPTHVKGNVAKKGGFVTCERPGPNGPAPGAEPSAVDGPAPGEQPLGMGAPNQAKPSQTNSNPAKPSKAGRLAASEAAAAVDMEEARMQAIKLKKAIPSLDRELGWQIAWVSVAIAPRMIGEIIERLKNGDVRKPRTYAEAAIRKECEDQGYLWSEIKDMVPRAPPRSQTPPEVVCAAAQMKRA